MHQGCIMNDFCIIKHMYRLINIKIQKQVSCICRQTHKAPVTHRQEDKQVLDGVHRQTDKHKHIHTQTDAQTGLYVKHSLAKKQT